MSSFSIEVRVKKGDLDVVETHLITTLVNSYTNEWFWQELHTENTGTGYSSEEEAAKAAEIYYGATRRLSQPGLN